MAKTVAILGRQPALGLAELESVFGPDSMRLIGQNTALLDVNPEEFPLHRLGGTIKAARYLTEVPFTDWEKLEKYLAQELPKHTCCVIPGKIRLGLSVYGFNVNIKRLNATGLSLKKAVKDGGRSVRVVPNQELELNAAQVVHNQLTGPTGFEILIIRNGDSTILAQTFAVQDIDAYAARDQARPKRDARVGMLPPKLAQIIVNLAVKDTDPKSGSIVYDPFCGTGVVLQEASLMGFDIAGSDLDPRMVAYTDENLLWLLTLPENRVTPLTEDKRWYQLKVADATKDNFPGQHINFIAAETYLGRPFSALPKPEILTEVMRDVNTIHKKFLENVARQTDPGFRMCLAVPAWKTKSGFKHLRVLDSLEELGYTRMKFVHISNDELIYHRPNQIVARELVVLERK